MSTPSPSACDLAAQYPPSVVASLRELLASLVIGGALALTVYGITILQTYFYYRTYPKDRLAIKILVGILFLLDTATSIVLTYGTYEYTVIYFLQPLERYIAIPPNLVAEHAMTILIILLTQLYFAQRLWYISKNRYLVFAITILALGGFGSGEAIAGHMATNPDPFSLGTVPVLIMSGFADGLSAICDLLIAGSLCYYLRAGKSGFVKTNSLVDQLMVYAIQRGLLTALCQIGKLVSVVAYPYHFVFLPFAYMQGKLYCNTLLASLNVRNSLRNNRRQDEHLEPGSHILVPMPRSHGFDSSLRSQERYHCATDTLEFQGSTIKSPGSTLQLSSSTDVNDKV
ncbi:hypothetical protein C8Q76DRAFT_799731 [Earliella scabrosa]|nr:hypothetical protein C8Q76DRAFT_799731 [Earliella scabrosa]